MTVDDLSAIPDMLHWYDGMLLLPEHFQAAHRRQEMLGAYLARTVAPHGWGVQALDVRIVDNSAVEVLKLDAVMPDGLPVRYRSTDSDEKDHELRAKLGDEQKKALKDRKKLMVHVTVRVWSDHLAVRDVGDPDVSDRYRSVEGARLERDDPDVAHGDAAAEQMRERPWLRPILKLDVGDGAGATPSSRYVALPIARLVEGADSKIVLDRYEPPRPDIAGAELLLGIAQDVATSLRDKGEFLGRKVERDRNLAGSVEFGAGPAVAIRMRQLLSQLEMRQRDSDNLRALVRTVPRLEKLAADRTAGPFLLYLTLCDIVGDLAMLGRKLALPKLPDYRHCDPLASFEALKAHIGEMLASLAQRYRTLRFDRTEPGRFQLDFKPADLGQTLIVGAERAEGVTEGAIRTWMANAVIATSEHLAEVRPRRISGQVREPIDRDDGLDLSPPAMTSLFRIDPSAEFIDREGKLLVIENKNSEGPTAIALYVADEPPGPGRSE
jgi:type VI secretion system protein ImpJ